MITVESFAILIILGAKLIFYNLFLLIMAGHMSMVE